MKSCNCCEYGTFEHLLFLVFYLFVFVSESGDPIHTLCEYGPFEHLLFLLYLVALLIFLLESGNPIHALALTLHHSFLVCYYVPLLLCLCQSLSVCDLFLYLHLFHHLEGLVVKTSALRVEGSGSNPACDRIFLGPVIPVS